MLLPRLLICLRSHEDTQTESVQRNDAPVLDSKPKQNFKRKRKRKQASNKTNLKTLLQLLFYEIVCSFMSTIRFYFIIILYSYKSFQRLCILLCNTLYKLVASFCFFSFPCNSFFVCFFFVIKMSCFFHYFISFHFTLFYINCLMFNCCFVLFNHE
jgi:hypothetical protein